MSDDRLTFSEWCYIHRGRLWNRLFRCPACGRRPRRDPVVPRWDEDKVARMLGLSVEGHCGDCGKRLES